ncbi:hypothetical protein [Gemmatimonas sp.]
MALSLLGRVCARIAPLLLLTAALPLSAQSLDDGLMLRARQLRVGVDHASESWREYWEGTRRRDNDNIGTLTTQSTVLSAGYGVSRRLSAFASVPYVQTNANAGVLSGMRGVQDFTFGLKARLFEVTPTVRTRLRATALVGGGVPTTNYTPDFLPMSIGLGAKHARVRAAMHLQDHSNFFADVSAGYQWRSHVTLDRPAYYTNGVLVHSNEVAMPDVRDAMLAVGFQNARWCIPLALVQQRTLGGGDIRRQDMPFVSNRMDFTRVQAHVMYTMPSLPVILNGGAMTTLEGRNVGKSTMYTFGVTYLLKR